MHPILRVSMIALVLSSAPGYAGGDAYPLTSQAPGGEHNSCRLDVLVVRDDQEVARVNMIVAFGVPAQARISNASGMDANFRIEAVANPVSKRTATATDSHILVNMVVLEQIAGAWVVLAEPSLRLVDGTTASLAIDDANDVDSSDRLALSVTATSMFDARAIDSVRENYDCRSLYASDAAIAPLLANSILRSGGEDGVKACCSAGCSDGTGRTLTCCGAVSCCACDSCCDNGGG